MNNQTPAHDRWILGPGPTRSAALIDILIFIGVSGVFWFAEELLRDAGRFPYPGLFDGGPTLIISFFAVIVLMRMRGQSWPALGLWKPRRWWMVPAWGLLVIVVNIAAQMTLVPLVGLLFDVPQPDLSRYDLVVGNLRMFLITASGAMITGGFMEEFIYRGLMVDRVARLFGGGKRGLILGALLCGVPFGLVHFKWGVGGMVGTAIMGSALGLMYLATKRNLWPLVAGHAALDFILMLQVYLGVLK